MKNTGGNAPIYYANNILKFVQCGKFSSEDDGFDGFKVRCELVKSRTNKAGKSVNLVYDQDRGFDPVRTMLEYADNEGLLDGRNPYKKFKGNDDVKFDSRKFTEVFMEREEVRNALYDTTLPVLAKSMVLIENEDDANKSDLERELEE